MGVLFFILQVASWPEEKHAPYIENVQNEYTAGPEGLAKAA
jgi:hypothetical protein